MREGLVDINFNGVDRECGRVGLIPLSADIAKHPPMTFADLENLRLHTGPACLITYRDVK